MEYCLSVWKGNFIVELGLLDKIQNSTWGLINNPLQNLQSTLFAVNERTRFPASRLAQYKHSLSVDHKGQRSCP